MGGDFFSSLAAGDGVRGLQVCFRMCLVLGPFLLPFGLGWNPSSPNLGLREPHIPCQPPSPTPCILCNLFLGPSKTST